MKWVFVGFACVLHGNCFTNPRWVMCIRNPTWVCEKITMQNTSKTHKNPFHNFVSLKLSHSLAVFRVKCECHGCKHLDTLKALVKFSC